MEIDKTTCSDLSIFHTEEEQSVFHQLNFTQTVAGRNWLMKFFAEPFSDVSRIRETQAIIRAIGTHLEAWPTHISNGTIMVMEKFYETPVDTIPDHATVLHAFTYKMLHGPDFSLTRYSVTHFADFLRGFDQLIRLLLHDGAPRSLRTYLQRADAIMKNEVIVRLLQHDISWKPDMNDTVYYGYFLRYRFKNNCTELIDIFGRLDAWYSMAVAVQKFGLCFPEFIETEVPMIEAGGLYHILLHQPVAYDVALDVQHNFLFLTGANMAGKSTFIKSVGTAVYLAHIGMGVPATHMRLSFFDGILSNINVTDNITKGESYFFNEVQRIKNTILKINNGRKWLVLIDELFKGTNVQDAMKCSAAVIKGLIRIKGSLFILSTHLYEIGEELKPYPNILFRYFETAVENDQLAFSYTMKEGISNDRLGYLILKREKVVELLEKL